ncbi:MAG: ATP-dependent protease subunit HslV [Bacteroidia bacterium]|nr:ATP-dependent protease subunit HslV [Bacteroidia bacterium]MDW8159204.1 ATP-dependent protease subunit HslV [Bacteroidia bacterium]
MKSPIIRGTTVLGIIHNGEVALGADGQVTFGNAVIMKANTKKVRKIAEGRILAGFAGATADSLTLLERFEEKLSQYNTLKRAAVELARDWRTDRYLRRLETMLVALNAHEGVILTGNGDVLEPDNHIFAIGSGGMYAQAAALALLRNAPHLSATEIVRQSLSIAAEICIFTNHNFEILTL